ncbi:ankyrin repeat domain-containing protein [Burkholderia cepacia]|uniref:ankyrin repeat domain-containing protein n=1 Tax=Burkholderia cepacia TaxID=292 RepID=UPI002AB69A32|nr:ankyrin repeat domain-containing protein [Burkholderia cepacia]
MREKIVVKSTVQPWNYLHASMRAKDPSFASDVDRRLPIAVKKGNFPRVKELIEHGADLHADDNEPLVLAIRHGYLQIADYLISVGANVEAHDQLGKALESSRGTFHAGDGDRPEADSGNRGES